MKHYKTFGLLCAAVLFGLIIQAATTANAGSTKLNGPLQSMGNVVQARFSPDENYIVYVADQENDESFELYSVPVTGGTPVRLNKDLPDGIDIFSFLISPDSQRVVYKAEQNAIGVTELFSVPITGPSTASVQLNETPVQFGNVSTFRISPDSDYVIYQGDLERVNFDELYRVPIAGPATASEKLFESAAEFEEVFQFDISANGETVVYSAFKSTVSGYRHQFFSVPLLGPVASTVALTDPLIEFALIDAFTISPDSTHVVYKADAEVIDRDELFSVPINGPANVGVKLNETLEPFNALDSKYFISSDSSKVVYFAQLVGRDEKEFYSVSIAGPASGSVRLSVDLAVNQDMSDFHWHITEDGANLVYALYEFSDFKRLYRVPISGTQSDNKLLLEAQSTAGADLAVYTTTPDGANVVFVIRPDIGEAYEMYSIPIEGPLGAETKLNLPLASGGNVTAWITASPNSQWLMYTAEVESAGTLDLYAVPVAGPATKSIKINPALVAGGNVSELNNKISPNGTWIAYLADQETDGMQELYLSEGNSLFLSNFVYLPMVTAE